jgi:hypothetical protein
MLTPMPTLVSTAESLNTALSEEGFGGAACDFFSDFIDAYTTGQPELDSLMFQLRALV